MGRDEWDGYNGALSMIEGQELFLLVSKAMEIESIMTLDWDIWTRVLVESCFGLLRPLGQRLTVTASPNISYSHAGNFFTIFHPTRPASTLTYYILVPKPLRDTRPLEEPVFRNSEILRCNLRIFHAVCSRDRGLSFTDSFHPAGLPSKTFYVLSTNGAI